MSTPFLNHRGERHPQIRVDAAVYDSDTYHFSAGWGSFRIWERQPDETERDMGLTSYITLRVTRHAGMRNPSTLLPIRLEPIPFPAPGYALEAIVRWDEGNSTEALHRRHLSTPA